MAVKEPPLQAIHCIEESSWYNTSSEDAQELTEYMQMNASTWKLTFYACTICIYHANAVMVWLNSLRLGPIIYRCVYTYCVWLSLQTKTLIHVWAGISMRERTGVCVSDGTMDATLYVDILRHTLLPILYLDGHRFMQDNDPNTCPDWLLFFLKTTTLTGGGHLPTVQISIP